MDERRHERKVVTVLFCDLVGFTSRAEEMDPEDVASLLGPYQARVKEELERYGGTVEKFIGDAVMALFGAPTAHEDDPERAVRAALAIREFALTEGLELRVGITTGEALVSLDARPEHGETMATGDVVNTAARLQAAAGVNGVLVSERTHEATRDTIDYRENDPVEAKGKSRPVPVWEAVDVLSDADHSETPFVGRENDLRLLEDALARVERERSCQLLTLVGVPGIGKSRLVRELSARRADVTWRHGRCLPYGEGITFWALGEVVKEHAGILESDTAEVAEAKLARVSPGDDWVRESLRPLCGLAVDSIDDSDRREETFVAWRRFVEGMAEDGTLVLVFEDVHWADDEMLAFVDHLVDWASGVPLLVVCTARPELLERRPNWGGGKPNALTVSLSPLSDDETSGLIARLIERAVMPAEAQAVLLARAGGNPLYAEQYVRMVVERTVAELSVPETVHGIIAARLDLVEPGHKALLQDAAVLGKTFWSSALATLAGMDIAAVETGIHVLERKGFVRRERDSSIEGDTEYAFLHLLVQEVAYGQLPRASRSEKHRVTAEWIAGLRRLEDHAEMLAYHYGQAVELARAAGIDTSALVEPARIALRDAGNRASSLHAYPQALNLYERALELWPDHDAERAELLLRRARAECFASEGGLVSVELLAEAREALLAAGAVEQAAEAEILEARVVAWSISETQGVERARSALERVRDAPASIVKTRVLADGARVLTVSGRGGEGVEVARDAVALAEQLGLEELRANALATIGLARCNRGDDGGLDDLEESVRYAEQHGSPDEILRGYNNLGWCYVKAGRCADASEAFARHAAAAGRFGMRIAYAKTALVIEGHLRGRWDEALALADELITSEAQTGIESAVHEVRALIRHARGDAGGTAEDLVHVRSFVDEDPDRDDELANPGVVHLRLSLARVALDEGRRADAVEQLGQVLAHVGERFTHEADTELVDLAWLVVELDRPRDPLREIAAVLPESPWHAVAGAIADDELVDAADRLAAIGAPGLEAYARLRAAEGLAGDGRRADADAQLERALAFYRSVRATRYVDEAEGLFAATA
jgi:class 3 adenylate cyclase/tetratricopeptide (TPR) repeat protein